MISGICALESDQCVTHLASYTPVRWSAQGTDCRRSKMRHEEVPAEDTVTFCGDRFKAKEGT